MSTRNMMRLALLLALVVGVIWTLLSSPAARAGGSILVAQRCAARR